MGLVNQPAIFTKSETLVALGVVAANGALVLVKDNRRAFLLALMLSCAALALALIVAAGLKAGAVGPFAFMVLLGVGMYVPYVAVHTTIFERLIALTRERGNIGFLMYLADSAGYLGYVALIISKPLLVRLDAGVPERFLVFFTRTAEWMLGLALLGLMVAIVYYLRLPPRVVEVDAAAEPTDAR